VVRRCLQKDPRDRYQTARDVYNELRELTMISGASTRRAAAAHGSSEMWIAVLPLRHPADAEMEALADGLNQDITAALSYDVRSASVQLGARHVLPHARHPRYPLTPFWFSTDTHS